MGKRKCTGVVLRKEIIVKAVMSEKQKQTYVQPDLRAVTDYGRGQKKPSLSRKRLHQSSLMLFWWKCLGQRLERASSLLSQTTARLCFSLKAGSRRAVGIFSWKNVS